MVTSGLNPETTDKYRQVSKLRVYFCLDSCLVYINFAHTHDHDYVLYLCGGTFGIVWMACFSLSSKKMENEENSG